MELISYPLPQRWKVEQVRGRTRHGWADSVQVFNLAAQACTKLPSQVGISMTHYGLWLYQCFFILVVTITHYAIILSILDTYRVVVPWLTAKPCNRRGIPERVILPVADSKNIPLADPITAPDFIFTSLSLEDGLFQTTVDTILQDSRGFT
jgi:hypothetical protein